MKKILPFILLLGVHFIKAQSYHSFPIADASWSERYGHNDSGGGGTDDTYTLSIDGDTIINNRTYHKLYATGFEVVYNVSGGVDTTINYTYTFYGCFREDSLKHIYMPDFGNEDLLYNFNLHLNDTLTDQYLYLLFDKTYVSSIDSIYDGSVYRKRFHLSVDGGAQDYVQLIEGVGSSFGLFHFTAPPLESLGTLYCFKDNISTVILDSIHCIYSNITELSTNNQIDIFPNPCSKILNFKYFNQKPKEIIISDLCGKMHMRKLFSNDDSIDLSDLSPGMYILSMQFETFVQQRTLIKL